MRDQKIFNTEAEDLENVTYDDKVIVRSPSLLPVSVSTEASNYLDTKTVAQKYYNSFNFSKLANKLNQPSTTIGITSANRQDGKTLVASNMAVSLASGYQQRTVLVDMNFNSPDLHDIFGVDSSPGLAEALEFKTIRVVPTSVENLFLMPAGDSKNFQPGIKHTMILRQVLQTLKNEFDFVVLDMCSILPIKDFPVNFINEVDGLISVIDAKRTKKEEFNKIFKHIDEKRFIGYIFNKVD